MTINAQQAIAKKASWGFEEFCSVSNIEAEAYPFNYEHHTMCDSGDEEEYAFFMSRLILDMKNQEIVWPQRNFEEGDYILNQNLLELEARAIRLTEESLFYAASSMAKSIRQEELKYLARKWDRYLAEKSEADELVEESYYREMLTSMPGTYLKAFIHYTLRKDSPPFMSEVAFEVASQQEDSSMVAALVALATDKHTASVERSMAKQVVDELFGVDASDPNINWRKLIADYK